MPKKDFEEKEEEAELKKIFTKNLNNFLSDYFNWIIAGAVFVVLMVGFFSLILPKYIQTVGYINKTSEREKFDFEAKNNELTKIKQLLSAYNSIDRRYIDKVNAVAPKKSNIEELFSEINYLVSKNQLSLQSVSLSEVGAYQDNILPGGRGADNIETASIGISVLGTNYESFKNFLSALENNLRLMDVTKLSFDPVTNSTILAINTYYTK